VVNVTKSKWTGRLMAAIFAGGPLSGLVLLPFLADKEMRAGVWLLAALLLAGFAAWVAATKIRRARAKRRMVFTNVCGTCGYDLLKTQIRPAGEGNPNEWAVCPECGRGQEVVGSAAPVHEDR
jgi:hypothetical protein